MNKEVWNPTEPRPRNIHPLAFHPHGLQVMQSWEQIGLYLWAIDHYSVDLFVEIGVAMTGLQQFITPRTKFVPDFQYLGCEAGAERIPSQPWQQGVYTYIGNCFNDGFAARLEMAIAQSRVTLLLCDGGDKPRELAYFKNFLRINDYIVVHDFTDEVQEEDLACLKGAWREVEPERYRAALIPLFCKVVA